MNHTPIRIVVRSVDHDGKSLLSAIVDEVDEAFVLYGEATQDGGAADVLNILDRLRRSQDLTGYIEHQMNMVARSYAMEQTSRNVLELIRAGVLEPAQMLTQVARELCDELQSSRLARELNGQRLYRATSALDAFVRKVVQIGEKILESRTENIRIETEFVKALEDVRRKHLSVTFHREGRFSGSIRANRGAVYLLFRELVSNSFKYRGAGRDLVIDTSQERLENSLILSYRDNGIGIPPSDCEKRIFEAGVRLDEAIALGNKDPSSSGRGLGLSIVKSIVTSMAGRITVQSTLGEGTLFVISLPVS